MVAADLEPDKGSHVGTIADSSLIGDPAKGHCIKVTTASLIGWVAVTLPNRCSCRVGGTPYDTAASPVIKLG